MSVKRLFVNTKEFEKQWEALGLTDIDLREVQNLILKNPKNAPVIQGTGGLRKIRASIGNKGKSGGIRVVYIDFEQYKIVYLIFTYAKKDADNLTAEEKQLFKKLIEVLENNLKRGAK